MPPHGRGAIRHGSEPGNTPGPGRPKDIVRARLLKILQDDGVQYVEDVVKGRVTYTIQGTCSHCGKESEGMTVEALSKAIPSPDTRLRAVVEAAKVTLDDRKDVMAMGDVREKLNATAALLKAEVPLDLYERIVGRLQAIWRGE